MALCEGRVRGSVGILRTPELDTECNFAPYCHLRILYIGGIMFPFIHPDDGMYSGRRNVGGTEEHDELKCRNLRLH